MCACVSACVSLLQSIFRSHVGSGLLIQVVTWGKVMLVRSWLEEVPIQATHIPDLH